MKKLLLVLTTCLVSPLLLAQTLKLNSQGGKVAVSVNDEEIPSHSIALNGETAITDSRLGLRFKKAAELDEGFAIDLRHNQTEIQLGSK